VIKVYDLEAKSWRSFRMDRLKKITAELNFN
jgi:predicted DNA-binding transcriptional regulator YafY